MYITNNLLPRKDTTKLKKKLSSFTTLKGYLTNYAYLFICLDCLEAIHSIYDEKLNLILLFWNDSQHMYFLSH